MPTKPIELEIAKQQLIRINETLDTPHLLIGGLAVQRYVPARNSKDIDLVCEHATAQKLLQVLYPSREWKIKEVADNSYRPSFHITHRSEDLGEIILGPKIYERESYKFLDWDFLLKSGKPYPYRDSELENIIIPTCSHLAFTKLISFLMRDKSSAQKRQQDLQDFVDLTNNDDFASIEFIGTISRAQARDFIINQLHLTSKEQTILKTSAIFEMFAIFGAQLSVSKSAKPSKISSKKHDMPLIENEVAKIAFKHREKKPIVSSHQDLVVVVDIQQDFFEGGALAAHDTESLVEPLNRFLLESHASGRKIVFTRDWHPEDHRSFVDWGIHCVKNTEGAKFHPRVDIPENTLVVDIGTDNFVDGYSPFDDLQLPNLIVTGNIRTIYVVGIALEFCVLATCRDALWFGKTVVAIEPLIRAANPDSISQNSVWDILTSMGVIRTKDTPIFN